MKRNRIRRWTIGLLLAAALLLAACGARDRPPDDGTPEPPALSGTYCAEGGSLTFNGDGKSIVIELSDALAEASGLPAGRREGQYVFLFQHGMWRYDKAEYFRIMLDGQDYQFRNGLGETNETTVSVSLIDGADPVRFVRDGK